jgi:hypothetical protein
MTAEEVAEAKAFVLERDPPLWEALKALEQKPDLETFASPMKIFVSSGSLRSSIPAGKDSNLESFGANYDASGERKSPLKKEAIGKDP